MQEEILRKIEAQQAKLDAIYVSVEKLRKYFKWTLIITVATILIPLIALIFAIPWFLGILTTAYGIG